MIKTFINNVSPIIMLPVAFCLFVFGVIVLLFGFLTAMADTAIPTLKLNKVRKVKEAKLIRLAEYPMQTTTTLSA